MTQRTGGAQKAGDIATGLLPVEMKPESFDYGRDALPSHVIQVVSEHLALENEAATREGRVGYLARGLVNASMPYKDPKTEVFKRVNGDYTLRIVGGDEGVPYGVYPRLLMCWLTTEVVRTSNQEIALGESLSDFLRTALGVERITGGRRGTGTLVVNQMKRLFGSMVSMRYESKNPGAGGRRPFAINNVTVADRLRMEDASGEYLWNPPKEKELGEKPAALNSEQQLWDPLKEKEVGFESVVRLSRAFYDEIRESPVPVNPTHYRALRDSPLAMDIYAWLTFRMSYLRTVSRPIPWEVLLMQFGSGYPSTPQGIRNFRKNFLTALAQVHQQYPGVRLDTNKFGLILKPSPTDVAKVSLQGTLPLLFTDRKK